MGEVGVGGVVVGGEFGFEEKDLLRAAFPCWRLNNLLIGIN